MMRFVIRAVHSRLPSSSVMTTSWEAMVRPSRIAVAVPVTSPDRAERWCVALMSTPTALRQAGKARVRKAIARRSPRLADKVTDAVFEALDAQSVTLPGEATWGQVIAELAADLDRIHTRRDELAGQIEEVFLEHPLGAVLVTLTGFGPRTGARTLAEIADPNRFADGAATPPCPPRSALNAASSVCATGCDGQRSPTESWPPLTAEGMRAARFRISVSGPGQNASISRCASEGRCSTQ